ncbi:hypothetical protein Q3G72_013278 [Acer saccharum]|nr:hypothetical protein Q3G72_013278 [Acer saccharum]
MTITASPCIKDSCLMVRGKVVFTQVPQNVVVSPASSDSFAFIGATSTTQSSRHVFSLGFLDMWAAGNTSFMSVQIQNLVHDTACWDIQKHLLHSLVACIGRSKGQFRTSLQGTPENELQFCIESGDASVQTLQAHEAVFMNSGDNPIELFKDSIEYVHSRFILLGAYSNIKPKRCMLDMKEEEFHLLC